MRGGQPDREGEPAAPRLTDSVTCLPNRPLQCDALIKWAGAAETAQPRHGGTSSNAPRTLLLDADLLALAARVREQAMKDKSYRASPVGQEVGRYLRTLKWADKSENTLKNYEVVLARLALDYAHYQTLAEFTTETIRDFLDQHWGDASPTTRRVRLVAVKSFLRWAVEERDLDKNPADKIKPPRRASVDRQAYRPDVLEALRRAQPTLREQIAIQMLALLGLRKTELRLLRVSDFDLARGTFLVHGKGGKVRVMPIGLRELKADLEVELIGRHPNEYLLHPRHDSMRPFASVTMHRWFKTALERADLPGSIKLHEMRHSAADNLWRQSGDMKMAQELLRHQSIATTEAYLHPTRDDLDAALQAFTTGRHA